MSFLNKIIKRGSEIKDIIFTGLFEALWVLLLVGLTGYMHFNWLEINFGDFSFIVPIILFSIGLLVLLSVLSPRWYVVVLMCAVTFIIFPCFQSIFEEGYILWCMDTDGGLLGNWGRLMQLLFWLGSLAFQLLALACGHMIRKYKMHNMETK